MKTNLCTCGCGNVVRPKQNYVWGHNSFGNKHALGKTSWNKGRPYKKQADNPAWKGEKASKVAKHARIWRLLGKANHCSFNTRHIATRYHWANIDHQHRPILSDWISLCPKCHKIFDGETGSKRSAEFKNKVSSGLKRAYAEGRRITLHGEQAQKSLSES